MLTNDTRDYLKKLCIDEFKRFYPNIKIPRIDYCNRITQSHGYLSFKRVSGVPNFIKLSNKSLNTEYKFCKTLVHELCHLIPCRGEPDHGDTWREAMELMGFEASAKTSLSRAITCGCKVYKIGAYYLKRNVNRTCLKCGNKMRVMEA